LHIICCLNLSRFYGIEPCIFMRPNFFRHEKTHFLLNYLWKNTMFSFFSPKCFWMLHVCLPYIGEEITTEVSLNLDTHILIFVTDLNRGKNQKGSWRNNDTLPSSLIDSNVNLKWKHWKSKGLEICSMVHSTLGVEGHAGAPGWD